MQEPEVIRPHDWDLQRALELHSLKFKKQPAAYLSRCASAQFSRSIGDGTAKSGRALEANELLEITCDALRPVVGDDPQLRCGVFLLGPFKNFRNHGIITT